MAWWNEIALLKRQLKEVQSELEKEQGKATRLAGYIARLQGFGVTPTGDAPRRPFAEALMDTLYVLLKIEQAALFETDAATLDLVPVAVRGFAPQVLTRLRVHPGEGVLGRAAQDAKPVIETRANAAAGRGAEDFLIPPYMIVPLLSQAGCVGLLLVAKPMSGSFTVEDRGLVSLLAAQAAIMLEDYTLFEDLDHMRQEMVASLGRAIEAKDLITHRHSGRTRSLVRPLTQDMSLPEILIQQIEVGAFLHDVGKIGIADAILRKTGELTPEEYAVMKTHPILGRAILEPIPALRAVGAIILYHQEWYNGAGYPEGLAGEEIPLGARIVQIIDAWDAMTSDRTYRKAMSKASAIAELRRQAGSQFDPKLVDLFLRVLDRLEREGVPTTEQPGDKSLASQRA
jgi:response regulator RpfG family c-di-GMP phosphodiesterase